MLNLFLLYFMGYYLVKRSVYSLMYKQVCMTLIILLIFHSDNCFYGRPKTKSCCTVFVASLSHIRFPCYELANFCWSIRKTIISKLSAVRFCDVQICSNWPHKSGPLNKHQQPTNNFSCKCCPNAPPLLVC